MSPRVARAKDILTALNYNERKVRAGKAEFLWADNFVKDAEQLSRRDILDRFRQRNTLNERAQKKILQISINFGIGEKLSNEQMVVLAKRFMQGFGLAHQPMVLYRHHDTSHAHLHVITTSIREDGSWIGKSPNDFHKAHQLTSSLEDEFGLSKHQRTKRQGQEQFQVRQAQRAVYGQSGLKRAISDVLNTVVEHYQYSSFKEFNAVLRLYNVRADRGEPSSKLYQRRGLIYHALDENGRTVGKYIAASSLLLKPTLANLEKRFEQNKAFQAQAWQRVNTSIDWTLAGKAPDWPGFTRALEKEGIAVVVQKEKKDEEGTIYFIDHREKAVFSGQGLGLTYSLHAILERCAKDLGRDRGNDLQHQLDWGL